MVNGTLNGIRLPEICALKTYTVGGFLHTAFRVLESRVRGLDGDFTSGRAGTVHSELVSHRRPNRALHRGAPPCFPSSSLFVSCPTWSNL